MPPLPPAAQTCAIVVGVESYASLGAAFAAPGAAVGALAFARWLVQARGVPPAQVQLWLAPADGRTAAEHAAEAGLGACDVRPFTGDAFWQAMTAPPAAWPAGWLVVYVCAHGVVSGPHNHQFLVLPEATAGQFLCIDTPNWRELFRGAGWQRYGHQLWVADACRNQWGDAMKPLPRLWQPGDLHPVAQCAMFACASGGTANLDSKQGPRFTRELLARLAAAPAAAWPAFDEALREVAGVLRADPDLAQWPTLTLGEDWFGLPLRAAADTGPTLRQAFEQVPLGYDELRPYVQRALPPQSLHALPEGLDAAFALLAGLPDDVHGVPPLWDFAERVAQATALPALRDWLDHHLSPLQRAALDQRLQDTACRAHLLLWYRDDLVPPAMEGELQVLDAGAGLRPWPRQPALPVSRDTLPAVAGAWLQQVFERARGLALELTVELYLPRELLAAEAYDTATVPLPGGDERRLGEDDPALLHCNDRFKTRTRRDRLLRHGPAILARLGQPGLAARWAQPGEAADVLRAAFIGGAPAAPVWLAFDPADCGGDAPLQAALSEGLPAVLWLRVPTDPAARAGLQASLDALLHAPLEQLPQRLRRFREQPPSPAARHVSLLLDDPARQPRLLTLWKS